MQLRLNKLILALILTVCWLGAGMAQAAEFSAVVFTRADSRESQGKVYLQGEKLRREFPSGEGMTITIARPDKKVMWLFRPGQKTYMEIPFDKSDLGQTMELPKDSAKMKLLGTETVNGYETEKYETTVTGQGKTAKHYMWVAKKLGLPIKIVSVDGKFFMEYRQIKEGGVPDGLFEIPPGYQKMALPQGPPPGTPRKK